MTDRKFVTIGEQKVSAADVGRAISPAQLADLLAAHLNRYSSGPKAAGEFVVALDEAHRTLQASVIRFLLEVLWAYKPDPRTGVDLRNEGAARACQSLRDDVERNPRRYFVPLI